MKDKLLTYAIGISVLVHLVGVCVVARTSASRLSAAPEKPQEQRLVKVDLVQTPDEATRPKPVAPKVVDTPRPEPRVNEPRPEPRDVTSYTPEQPKRITHSTPHQAPRDIRPHHSTSRPAGNPGGKLNIGSTSSHGDIGGLDGGKTQVGYVPGSDRGKGQGSGSGVGIGTPDPPKRADDGPGEHPAPRHDPPPPRMVSVRVCRESGLLPGKYCDRIHSESFIDGKEPSRTCDRCRAPEPPKRDPEPVHVSRLADRAEPVLISDPKPLKTLQAPTSIPEGKTLTVTVEFTCAKDGSVEDIRVSKSSGYRNLDKLVVDSVSRRKYKPAVQNGEPRNYPKSVQATFNT